MKNHNLKMQVSFHFKVQTFFSEFVGLYLKTASRKPGIASLHLIILTFFVSYIFHF